MCFSAEVSFGASAVLAATGVVAYKQAGPTELRSLAFIPFLFAIQQFTEGLVWLSHDYDSFLGVRKLSSYLFIFFAWIIWPLYIPLVLWRLESNKIRKQILQIFLVMGIATAVILLYVELDGGVNSYVLDCSIYYDHGLDVRNTWIVAMPYLLATVFSNMVTSLKWMWALGILTLLSYYFSKIYYRDHVISVWCFFAAIISVLFIFIIRKNKKEIKS